MIDKKELKTIIEKVAPILYFHPDEKYLMTSVDWFVQRALLHNIAENTDKPVSLNTLPVGQENENKYQLKLKNPADRNGDFSQAKTYVHAKLIDDTTLDLQFWFFYAYNGPGTARIKLLFINTGSDAHSGNSSLTPLGEHEGDWEHITVRVNTSTHEIQKIYFSQHSGGQWCSGKDIELENGQPIVYSSLNGHASYPHIGSNYSEHHKYPDPAILASLEFFLVNDTQKGLQLNCQNHYELVSAMFLPENERPVEPDWLNFLNRWGTKKEAHLTKKAVADIVQSAVGKIGKIAGLNDILANILAPILTYFVKENQDGPTGPKMKNSWTGAE